jgi:hypothetical protein
MTHNLSVFFMECHYVILSVAIYFFVMLNVVMLSVIMALLQPQSTDKLRVENLIQASFLTAYKCNAFGFSRLTMEDCARQHV